MQDVARVMQEATQSGGVRPYGVSLLIAGWDDGVEPETEELKEEGLETEAEKKKASGKTGGILKGGPSLYQVDPSGSYFPWKATAIGKSATSAKTFLEKRYKDDLELEDAVHIALLTLKETIEGEMNGETVEIGKSIIHNASLQRYTHAIRNRWPTSRPPTGLRRSRRSAGAKVPKAEQGGDRRLPDQFVMLLESSCRNTFDFRRHHDKARGVDLPVTDLFRSAHVAVGLAASQSSLRMKSYFPPPDRLQRSSCSPLHHLENLSARPVVGKVWQAAPHCHAVHPIRPFAFSIAEFLE